MTPAGLSRQEEHLFAVLSGKRFLRMEGLSNEVPFFIYPYPPEDALAVAAVMPATVRAAAAAKLVQARARNRLLCLAAPLPPEALDRNKPSSFSGPRPRGDYLCVGGMVARGPGSGAGCPGR